MTLKDDLQKYQKEAITKAAQKFIKDTKDELEKSAKKGFSAKVYSIEKLRDMKYVVFAYNHEFRKIFKEETSMSIETLNSKNIFGIDYRTGIKISWSNK